MSRANTIGFGSAEVAEPAIPTIAQHTTLNRRIATHAGKPALPTKREWNNFKDMGPVIFMFMPTVSAIDFPKLYDIRKPRVSTTTSASVQIVEQRPVSCRSPRVTGRDALPGSNGVNNRLSKNHYLYFCCNSNSLIISESLSSREFPFQAPKAGPRLGQGSKHRCLSRLDID